MSEFKCQSKKMEKTDESKRYKWSTSATNLLVTIWCHDLVQKQLKMSSRNQPLWESIARYMSRKGYSVTGLQCKTRIKNMLCSYHESLRKNEITGAEPYFNIFQKVLQNSHKKSRRDKIVREVKSSTSKKVIDSSETSEENEIDLVNLNHSSDDPVLVKETTGNEYLMEFVDITKKCQTPLNFSENELEPYQNLILQAIHKQTQAITNAINSQSQIIEKLFAVEKNRLNMVIESRRQLENKLDRLLDKLDMKIIPQTTYTSTLIETTSSN